MTSPHQGRPTATRQRGRQLTVQGWQNLVLAAMGVVVIVGLVAGALLMNRTDRLARDLMVQETIIADLRKNGFELVSAAEPDLMANDPTRILVRQMMGAVAQYEKSQIVLKLRGAYAEAGEGGALRGP